MTTWHLSLWRYKGFVFLSDSTFQICTPFCVFSLTRPVNYLARSSISFGETEHTHHYPNAIITSLLRRNDVATSLRRNNDVIIASCVHWDNIPLESSPQCISGPLISKPTPWRRHDMKTLSALPSLCEENPSMKVIPRSPDSPNKGAVRLSFYISCC